MMSRSLSDRRVDPRSVIPEIPVSHSALIRRRTTLIATLFLVCLVSMPCLAQGQASGEPAAVSPPWRGMTFLDWSVIGVYALGMLAIGWYYSVRTRNKDDYLLGGRNMRSSSVGLSLFSTLFSTITYLAMPGEMISKGPVILWSMMSIPIAYVVVGYFLIPHFMRLRMTSAYEILETRLGVGIRLLAAIVFLATRFLWMALIVYVTSEKIIVTMMDLPPDRARLIMPIVAIAIGLITVVYTTMGGLRAVVLTDVIQSFILMGGAILAVVLITIRMGGVGAWWPTTWSPHWDQQPIFSWDPTIRVTVVGSIVMMTVWWICTAGSDQMAIQRYFATRDVKAARRVFLVTGLSNIAITCLLAAVGFALLAFFESNKHLAAEVLYNEKKADTIFPFFIVRYVPPGITGLILAALLAAAMSSLSAGVNSACSVIKTDFIDRFWKGATGRSDRSQVVQTRIISFLAGVFMVLLSLVMGQIKGNIMEVTVRTNHVFVAPLFGLFFMALFVRRATPIGAACGAIAGCIVAVLFAYWDLITAGLASLGLFSQASPQLSFQWISLFSLLAHLAVGIPVSRYTYKENRAGGSLVTGPGQSQH
jgi:SSS family solute:Na+ symporter